MEDIYIDMFLQQYYEENINIKQIHCGMYHTVVLTGDSQLFVCGYNEYGQLGIKDRSNIIKFTKLDDFSWQNTGIKQITCGGNHTYVLTNDNQLFTCGRNTEGQLGLGDLENRNIFTKLSNVPWQNTDINQIVCGGYHTFVLTNDNQIYACGNNTHNELGLGYIDNKNKFTKLENSPWQNAKIRQIICGWYHTYILTYNNDLFACGLNEEGQLGLGDNKYRTVFAKLVYTPWRGSSIKQVACGYYYTFVLTDNNQLFACGNNLYGQLSLGDNIDRNLFIRLDNSLWGNKNIKQINCGNTHLFILTDDNYLFSCGSNRNGCLGFGDMHCANRNIFTKLDYFHWQTNDIKQVMCGDNCTFFLTNNQKLFSCGFNLYGQLGLNDKINRYAFALVPNLLEQQFRPELIPRLLPPPDPIPQISSEVIDSPIEPLEQSTPDSLDILLELLTRPSEPVPQISSQIHNPLAPLLRPPGLSQAPLLRPPGLSQAPPRTESLQTPETPETPEISRTPETPETHETPETPEISRTPETLEISQPLQTQQIPQIPQTPQMPQTPETLSWMSQTPETTSWISSLRSSIVPRLPFQSSRLSIPPPRLSLDSSPGLSDPIRSLRSHTPRTTSQIPRTTSQIPRTTSQIPQTTSQTPQTTSQTPQTSSQIPQTTSRTSSRIPRTTSPQTSSRTPRISSQTSNPLTQLPLPSQTPRTTSRTPLPSQISSRISSQTPPRTPQLPQRLLPARTSPFPSLPSLSSRIQMQQLQPSHVSSSVLSRLPSLRQQRTSSQPSRLPSWLSSHTPLQTPSYQRQSQFELLPPIIFHPDIKIKLNKKNVFIQLCNYFKTNSSYLARKYWMKLGNSMYPDAIRLMFTYKDSINMDYGGPRNEIFYDMFKELKNRQQIGILNCDAADFFVSISRDFQLVNTYDTTIEYSIFLGKLIGLCFQNNIKLGFALNPFLIYKLLRGPDTDISDDILKKIIAYCKRVKNESGLNTYNVGDESLFDDIANDKDDSGLSKHGLSLDEIVIFKYCDNHSISTIMHFMCEGFILINSINQKNDDNIIEAIDNFVKRVYGNYDIDVNKIINTIFIDGVTSDKEKQITESLKKFLNEDKKENSKKLYGYFTNYPYVNYNKTLEIIVEDRSDIVVSTCGDYVCIPEKIGEDQVEIDTMLIEEIKKWSYSDARTARQIA
jgi:alpha-tubulin suppressor-like RCC1 family protein